MAARKRTIAEGIEELRVWRASPWHEDAARLDRQEIVIRGRLAREMLQNTYQTTKARAMWTRLAQAAAGSYRRQFKYNFPVKVVEETGRIWTKDFEKLAKTKGPRFLYEEVRRVSDMRR